MNLDKIIAAFLLLGSETPAFKALLQQILGAFKEEDQAKLKQSYAEAILNSDDAHADAQNIP